MMKASPPPLPLSDGQSMRMMEYRDGTFREVLGLRWVSCTAVMEIPCLAMLSTTQSIFPRSPQMLICWMVNGGAGGVDVGVLGEEALGLLVQQGPVKTTVEVGGD